MRNGTVWLVFELEDDIDEEELQLARVRDATAKLVLRSFAVKNTVERWPALFTQSQSLVLYLAKTEFFQELDRFTPRFIDIFWAKGEDIGSRLKKILQQTENKKSNINAVRTAVLHGLPLLLGEDPSDFYKIHFDCDDNEDISHIEKGILTVIPKGSATIPYSLHLDATTTTIILEGTVVVDEHENIPQAICLLFGLIYALNLSCNTEEHIRLHTESDFVHWPKF